MNRTNCEEELIIKEWEELFEREEDFYIYGAANTAKRLLKIMEETGVSNKLKGFLVTDKNENPYFLQGLPVIDVNIFSDKEANILVPHSGVFKQEILKLLDKLELKKVYLVRAYMHLMSKKERLEIKDTCMEEVQKRVGLIEKNKTPKDREGERELFKQISEIIQQEKPDFGYAEIYQSYERIGITGTRPTLYRIIRYGLEKILNKEHEILDIGCNCGFLDMSIASIVRNCTGIEYNSCLINIADKVKSYLNIENCEFINKDFHKWFRENKKSFNVIFSFAIHHWLNLSPCDYANKLDSLLMTDGYICLESHDLSCDLDYVYESCIEEFIKLGYCLYKEGKIVDDGITPRAFVILYKPGCGYKNEKKSSRYC